MKILRVITSGYQIGEVEYTGKYLPTLHTTDIPITDEQAMRMAVSPTSTYLIEINDSNREWIEDQLRKQ